MTEDGLQSHEKQMPPLPEREGRESLSIRHMYDRFTSDPEIRRECDALGNSLLPLTEAPRPDAEPMCTIVMPVIASTNIEKLQDNLRSLKEASHDKPVRLVLWVNDVVTDQEATGRILEKFNEIKESLVGLDDPDSFQIDVALHLSRNRLSMSEHRHNSMAATLNHAVRGEYDLNHPVIWIDDDASRIDEGALSDLSEAVRNGELFPHATTRYEADWVDWNELNELSDLDAATKAFLIAEAMRRRDFVRYSPRAIENDYIEEPGLAFSLMTYMMADGVDTSDPYNEAPRLIRRAWEAAYDEEKLDRYGAEYVNAWKRSITPSYEDYYVESGIGVSGRNFMQELRHYGPGSSTILHLYNGGMYYEGHGTYSTNQEASSSSPDLTAAKIHSGILEALEHRYESRRRQYVAKVLGPWHDSIIDEGEMTIDEITAAVNKRQEELQREFDEKWHGALDEDREFLNKLMKDYFPG